VRDGINLPERPNYPPIILHAIVWWDEHHEKVVLGHTSEYETRVRRDEEGTAAEGGVLPPRHDFADTKFTGNAGGCFGVGIKRNEETGKLQGIKCEPFSYLGRTVVAVKTYADEIEAELHRVKALRGIWGEIGKGYKEKYPETWKAQVKEKVDKTYCNITDIMDHVIKESDKLYAGTQYATTYMIFHDALPQWFEKEAQEYMSERGFKTRQVRNLNTANCETRYNDTLVGNSPYCSRGTDSHGFAHLVGSVKFHCALSSVYPVGDLRRFQMGTPKDVWSTMLKCWTVAPTSEQIIDDILAFPDVIEVIIENQGCSLKV
jgi:hypothetical protein